DLQNLSVEMIDEIIRDDLLNSIEFNIDGCTNDLHFASKRLSIDHVNAKFPRMLELRERYRSSIRITISVLPLRKYIDSTLLKIAVGESRRTLLDRLATQQFAAIGGPCQTVNCCVM